MAVTKFTTKKGSSTRLRTGPNFSTLRTNGGKNVLISNNSAARLPKVLQQRGGTRGLGGRSGTIRVASAKNAAAGGSKG